MSCSCGRLFLTRTLHGGWAHVSTTTMFTLFTHMCMMLHHSTQLPVNTNHMAQHTWHVTVQPTLELLSCNLQLSHTNCPNPMPATAAPMHSPSHSMCPLLSSAAPPLPAVLPPLLLLLHVSACAAPATTISGIKCSSLGCESRAPGALAHCDSSCRRCSGCVAHALSSQVWKSWVVLCVYQRVHECESSN